MYGCKGESAFVARGKIYSLVVQWHVREHFLHERSIMIINTSVIISFAMQLKSTIVHFSISAYPTNNFRNYWDSAKEKRIKSQFFPSARRYIPFRYDMMRDYYIPGASNILPNLVLRDLENYPINHYYREAFLIHRKRTGITSAPRYIHHTGKRSDNALSLFCVMHAMRDHSVYDIYGV